MRVLWLNDALRLEPESDHDRERLLALENAIRTLAGMRIADVVPDGSFSSPELDQAALGSASNAR